MKIFRRVGLVAAVLAAAFAVVAVVGGSALIAPHPIAVRLPADLAAAESVVLPSQSGSLVHGSFLPGLPGHGAVVLLHGVGGSRLAMVDRARLLSRDGYAVLFIDFQASGESPGEHVTFGYLEARDAAAAVDYLKARVPGEKIGVIGVSMGGAAAALAAPPLPVDAMVLEEVYATITDAVDNRMTMHYGAIGPLLAPALTVQLWPRLGITTDELRPIVGVASMRMPKLFIVGAADRLATLTQSRALFAAAAEPKELWVVDGAQHVDMFAFAPDEYSRRVEAFLASTLR